MKDIQKQIQTWLKDVKATLSAESKRKDNRLVIAAVTLAVLVMVGVTLAYVFRPDATDAPNDQDGGTVQDDDDQSLRHPLTGEVLDAQLDELPQVFGVMIENAADAWPLTGVEDAFLVIEAPVEGAIPRFVAFYSSEQEVDKIGPVRSARPYYLDWNDELDGVYAHVGGSPEALDLVKRYGTLDLNEFSQGEYYWRDTARRSAPHNVYTSTALLRDALSELEPSEPDYQTWKFKSDAPVEGGALSVMLDWGQGVLYDLAWRYDAETNAYLREQNGEAYKTTDGNRVSANNVVVMATDIEVIDSVTRRHIKTVGGGAALIVQDGKIELGTWKKDSRTDRLRFYGADGAEVKFNAGKTWIEVVTTLDKVSTVPAGQ